METDDNREQKATDLAADVTKTAASLAVETTEIARVLAAENAEIADRLAAELRKLKSEQRVFYAVVIGVVIFSEVF